MAQAQAQALAPVQIPVMVKPLGKFKTGMNLSTFKIAFHQYCRRLHIELAESTAVLLRDNHIFNKTSLSDSRLVIPSANDMEIFFQIALIVHRDRNATKITGATVFADDEQEQDDGGDAALQGHFARVIDILQRNIDAQIDPVEEDDEQVRLEEQRHIELIRTYLRHFKVLLPEEIQTLIRFLRLPGAQRTTQQDTLRAEVISAFGDVVSGIETYKSGIDAYIFVLQTLDGLSGSEFDLRNKILLHIQSWGITNTDSPQSHFAVLEQWLKLAGKFGIEFSSEDLKQKTITALLSSGQKNPGPIITVATNHRILPTSTFEQMVMEFNQVSCPKVADTEHEPKSTETTQALQATNQASGPNHDSGKPTTKHGKKSPHDLHHLRAAAQDRLQGQVQDGRAAQGHHQSSYQLSNGAASKFRKDGSNQGQQARTGPNYGRVERHDYNSSRNSRGNDGQQTYPDYRRDNFSGDSRYNNPNQRSHYHGAALSRRDSWRQDFRRGDDQDRPRSGPDYRYGSARDNDRPRFD